MRPRDVQPAPGAVDQRRRRTRHGIRHVDVHHRTVDQIDRWIEVMGRHQQREAKDPGAVGLPFQPSQVLRHELRRDRELLDVVEAAAMHVPGLALYSWVEALAGLHPCIERNEEPIPAIPCVQRTSRLIQSSSVSIIGLVRASQAAAPGEGLPR
jgi:hypothetical protein